LWFDVEEGYNTTQALVRLQDNVLWFDVEEGYNTTQAEIFWLSDKLWFDVEEGYNTTADGKLYSFCRCGLM